jgi:hypothetical protein
MLVNICCNIGMKNCQTATEQDCLLHGAGHPSACTVLRGVFYLFSRSAQAVFSEHLYTEKPNPAIFIEGSFASLGLPD